MYVAKEFKTVPVSLCSDPKVVGECEAVHELVFVLIGDAETPDSSVVSTDTSLFVDSIVLTLGLLFCGTTGSDTG